MEPNTKCHISDDKEFGFHHTIFLKLQESLGYTNVGR